MSSRRPAPAQMRALGLAIESKDGLLVRVPGGFWTRPDEPHRVPGVPVRSEGIGTIRALEAAGWLERTRQLAEWHDPRRITPAGRRAYEENRDVS